MPDAHAHNQFQRNYFTDRILPRMVVTGTTATPYVRRHVDAVVATAHLTSADRTLDIGCGPGKYTAELAHRGIPVEGMDLTPALIDSMRVHVPDVPAYVGDAAEPPDELLDRFDAVVGFMMLHHVADLTAIFTGVRRMLTGRGRICFLEPNPFYPGFAVQIAVTPGMTFHGEGGIYRLTPTRVHRALSTAGFSNATISHFGVFPPLLANRPEGARVEKRLEEVPGWRRFQAFQVISAKLA